MTCKEMEMLSKGISNDMSPKAIMRRLNIVRDLYEAAKRLNDFHKINGKFGRQLPELQLKVVVGKPTS